MAADYKYGSFREARYNCRLSYNVDMACIGYLCIGSLGPIVPRYFVIVAITMAIPKWLSRVYLSRISCLPLFWSGCFPEKWVARVKLSRAILLTNTWYCKIIYSIYIIKAIGRYFNMYRLFLFFSLSLYTLRASSIGSAISTLERYQGIVSIPDCGGSWTVIRLAGNDNDGRESAMTRTKRKLRIRRSARIATPYRPYEINRE